MTGTKSVSAMRLPQDGGSLMSTPNHRTGSPVIQPNGKRKRPHLFRIVLSHSRKAYSEVVYRQTTEAFIRCLEDAFCHFGGVPKTLVVDNLKAAVIKADWFDPDLNPKIQAFARKKANRRGAHKEPRCVWRRSRTLSLGV